MSIAVVLYFDKQTETRLLSIWRDLAKKKLSTFLVDIGIRPHISLAVFQKNEIEDLLKRTQAFAKNIKSFEINLCSVGSFPISGRPIFYLPVPTTQLLDIHSQYHNSIGPIGLNCEKYYLPGNWVPHCTVAENISDEDLFKQIILDCCNAGMPVNGRVTHIGIFEYMPIKEIVDFALS